MLLRKLPGPRKRVGERVHTYALARTKTISRPKYTYIYRELIRESAPLASLNYIIYIFISTIYLYTHTDTHTHKFGYNSELDKAGKSK